MTRVLIRGCGLPIFKYIWVHLVLEALESFGPKYKEKIFLGLVTPLALVTTVGEHPIFVASPTAVTVVSLFSQPPPPPPGPSPPLCLSGHSMQLAASSIEEAAAMEALTCAMEVFEYFTYLRGVRSFLKYLAYL